MKDTLLIRADASATIGAGHVMRMLALAQAWIDKGKNVCLVSATCPDSLAFRIESETIEHRSIRVSPGSLDDAKHTLELANEFACRWIVVDGYQFDFAYQKYLKSSDVSLLVVDDFAYEQKWYADVILNQNLFAEDWFYESQLADTKLLLGSRFVLLRRELRQAVPEKSASDSTDRLHVLITLGGGDTASVVQSLLAKLQTVSSIEFDVRVLVSSACSNLSELEQFSSNHQTTIVSDVRDMSAEYLFADAVISGAGSTCWEWLYYQLPGAVVRMADNQMPVADELVRRDLAIDLGWHEDLDTLTGLPEKLEHFLGRVKDRKNNPALTKAERTTIIDGKGAQRVCDLLLEN